MSYERTCQIERGSAKGVLSGVLATDGEASDGHIIDIDGLELPERAPLLFGHDDVTGTGNLGSWTAFEKFKGKGLGSSGVRGEAQIELGGSGAQKAFREDVAHMVAKGHIPAFSVRWDPTEEPIRRTSMPSDHPAHVDSKKAQGRQAWGLFFPRSRLLEGSVVTLGADPAALIGRLQASDGEVRGYWRKAINHALTEREDVAGLVGVQTSSGEVIYVERAAWEAMLEEANERLQIALDIHEQTAVNIQTMLDDEDEEPIRSEGERTQRDDPEETAAPAAQEQKEATATLPVITPGDVLRQLREGFAMARQDARSDMHSAINRVRGKVNT